MSTLVINRTIKSIAGSCDLPRCCNCCSTRLYRIVTQVVAVCAAPCVRFGPFNAFLLLFQKEQSQGTSATTVTRGTMDLKCHLLWMEIAIHYFIVVEDNN